MMDALVLPVEAVALLRDELWPVTQFGSALEDQFLDDNEDDHFVGQR
jgi:hypothetical protein